MFIDQSGALAFDMDYAHWVDEHQRLLNDLRSALNSQMGDNELHLLVDGVMAHYNELFRLKSIGAKADIFHMLYGQWKTPVERFFIWHGAFRSSELLKVGDINEYFTTVPTGIEPGSLCYKVKLLPLS
jgi:transcription factor TGA